MTDLQKSPWLLHYVVRQNLLFGAGWLQKVGMNSGSIDSLKFSFLFKVSFVLGR